MFRVLVTDDVDAEGVEVLQTVADFQVDVVPTLKADALLERIGEYDAIVGRSATKISEQLLERGTKLKVVGRAGVGVDNVAMDRATQLGIAVINAPAGNTIAVTELFFGAVIGLLRHIPPIAQSMREGRWDRSRLMGSELKGRTLGIVGLGRIGSEGAKRATAFGMEVAGYDPYISDERFVSLRVKRHHKLDELLSGADVVTIHTPLNDETKGMVGAHEIARLKKGAVLVNMARGGIVDDAALAAALREGRLAAAGLDVFEGEPRVHPDLLALDNVLLSPHIASATTDTRRAMTAVAVDNVLAFFGHGPHAGRPPNLLNPEALAAAGVTFPSHQ